MGTENGVIPGTLTNLPIVAGTIASSNQMGAGAISSDEIWSKHKFEWQINASGTIRVSYDILSTNQYSISTARIYKNGVTVGTERTTTGLSWVTFTEDIAVNAGDLIQLYTKTDSSGSSASVKNACIKTNALNPVYLVITT